MIKQKLSYQKIKVNRKIKEPHRRHENQRVTHLHIQECHKNTKLKTPVYMQGTVKTCIGPVCTASVSGVYVSLIVLVFSISVSLPYSFCFLFHGVPWVLREGFDGDTSFRRYTMNILKLKEVNSLQRMRSKALLI